MKKIKKITRVRLYYLSTVIYTTLDCYCLFINILRDAANLPGRKRVAVFPSPIITILGMVSENINREWILCISWWKRIDRHKSGKATKTKKEELYIVSRKLMNAQTTIH